MIMKDTLMNYKDKEKKYYWHVLQSYCVFEAQPWIKVMVEELQLPDDRMIDDYHQIQLPDYVVVFAQTKDGDVIVEQSYKHGVRGVSLSLPAGLIEGCELPLQAAQRELLEETGYAMGKWQFLGRFVQHGNYGCGKAHLFMAKNVRQISNPYPDDLEEIEVKLLKM